MEKYPFDPQQILNDMYQLTRDYEEGRKEIERQFRKKKTKIILEGVAAYVAGWALLMALYVYLTN